MHRTCLLTELVFGNLNTGMAVAEVVHAVFVQTPEASGITEEKMFYQIFLYR